jgi:NarL family two-component system response regulator LiaR
MVLGSPTGYAVVGLHYNQLAVSVTLSGAGCLHSGVGILVAVAGAQDIVASGLRAILDTDPEIEVMARYPGFDVVPDVLLYDVIAIQRDDGAQLFSIAKELEPAVVVIGRDLRPGLAARALAHGVDACVSIEAPATEILSTIHAAARGDFEHAVSAVASGQLGFEAGLSHREVDVLGGIAKGYSNTEIAGLLELSGNTVKSYIRTGYRKINASSRAQAVAWCLANGFEPPPST